MKIMKLSILLLALVALVLVGCEVPTTGQAVARTSTCTLQGNCNAITKVTNDVNALSAKANQFTTKDTQHDTDIAGLKAKDTQLDQRDGYLDADIDLVAEQGNSSCYIIGNLNSNHSYQKMSTLCREPARDGATMWPRDAPKKCAAYISKITKTFYKNKDCLEIESKENDFEIKPCFPDRLESYGVSEDISCPESGNGTAVNSKVSLLCCN